MARQVLGGLTTLNLATNLDPMFAELYDASFMTALITATVGAGAGVRQMRVNGGSAAAEGAVFTGLRAGANSFVIGNAGGILGGAETADLLFYSYGAVSQRFYTNGSERFRIDASGNVGIGGTGAVPSPGGRGPVLDLYSGTTQPAVTFHNSVTGIAAARGGMLSQTGANFDISNFETGTINFSTAGTLRGSFSATGVFTPGADNAQTLGSGALRWSVVYAGTGAINTSDAREKTKVASLTERELAAAKQLSKEIGAFKFLASVDTKGDDARMHIGMTVQRAIEVMREHELDPFAYAFICYDEWEAVEHPAEFKTEERDTGLVDTAGNAITETIKTEIKPAYTTPAGNRYGFRVDQLNLFIARGLAARLDDLESGSATA